MQQHLLKRAKESKPTATYSVSYANASFKGLGAFTTVWRYFIVKQYSQQLRPMVYNHSCCCTSTMGHELGFFLLKASIMIGANRSWTETEAFTMYSYSWCSVGCYWYPLFKARGSSVGQNYVLVWCDGADEYEFYSLDIMVAFVLKTHFHGR